MNPYFEELASAFQDALFLTVDVDDVKVTTVRSVDVLFRFEF